MADLSHWDFALDFTGEESASLIAGIDPAQVGFVREKVAPVLSRIERSYELAWGHYRDVYMAELNDLDASLPKDALESRDMHRKVEHDLDHEGRVQFAGWLLDDASNFERQRFSRTQLADWLDAVGLTSVYPFNPSAPMLEPPALDRPLDTIERNTLLTIIAVLCKEAKIPHDKHSKAASMIHSTAATMGVSIGESTIEGHLKRVRDALATRMK